MSRRKEHCGARMNMRSVVVSEMVDGLHYPGFSVVFFFFEECLSVINVEAHAAHFRTANKISITPHPIFTPGKFFDGRG